MELMDEFINFVNNWKAKNYFSTNPDGSLTEESLLKFLNDINAKINEIPFELQGNNARFYFYSNFVVKENSTGYSGYDYVSEVQIKDRNARSIYDTKAGRLFDGRLYDAIQRTVGSERLAYRLIGGLDWDNSSNSYVRSSPYGVDLGNGRKALSITDTISQLYAQRTIYGDVFIIMPNADTNSVLYQSELLSIINNPRVRSVNGESITNIKARYSSEGLLGVFNYLKSENAKLMDGLVKPDGKGGYDVNVDPFVKNPSEAWLNDYEKQLLMSLLISKAN